MLNLFLFFLFCIPALAGASAVVKQNPVVGSGDPTKVMQSGPNFPDPLVIPLSEGTVDLIIDHETGGRTYYTKYYEKPQDPGFSSGVTVGFGYDLKFHTKDQIKRDWAGVASPFEIQNMMSVAGLDGSYYTRIRSNVHISWEEAKTVFFRTTLPRWAKNTKSTYNLSETTLHPDSNGAMVSLSFNRGTSLTGSKRGEMKKIKDYIASGRVSEVRQLFYDMQKYWPSHARLKQRRREEGDFFDLGVNKRKKYN